MDGTTQTVIMLGGMVGSIGFATWQISNSISRKIGRVKDVVVSKELCNERYVTLTEDIKEIKGDVKTLLRMNGRKHKS